MFVKKLFFLLVLCATCSVDAFSQVEETQDDISTIRESISGIEPLSGKLRDRKGGLKECRFSRKHVCGYTGIRNPIPTDLVATFFYFESSYRGTYPKGTIDKDGLKYYPNAKVKRLRDQSKQEGDESDFDGTVVIIEFVED